MELIQITLKRLKIQEELALLKKQEEDLLLSEYRENLGKYFKQEYHNFSIRIDDIFIDHDRLYIVGPTYYSNKDNVKYKFSGFKQYSWAIECIKDWSDLCLEEISKEEFIQTFYNIMGQAIEDFNSIIFNKQ